MSLQLYTVTILYTIPVVGPFQLGGEPNTPKVVQGNDTFGMLVGIYAFVLTLPFTWVLPSFAKYSKGLVSRDYRDPSMITVTYLKEIKPGDPLFRQVKYKFYNGQKKLGARRRDFFAFRRGKLRFSYQMIHYSSRLLSFVLLLGTASITAVHGE